MSTLYVLAGSAIAFGLVLVVVGLAPPRRDLAAAVGRWELARRHAGRPNATDTASAGERLGTWLGDTLAKRGTEVPQKWREDLAVTGRSIETFLTRLVMITVVTLALTMLLGIVLQVLSLPLGFPVPAGAGVAIAAVLIVNEIRELGKEADGRRDELRRALGTYLDLVSMSLAGGRSITEALPSAATIGTGWTFELIGHTVSTSRSRGVTPWEALGELGDEYSIRELTDLSAALGLVGDSGSKVRQSLGARAATLRRRQLAEARSEADQSSENMRLTQLMVAIGFLAALMYPAAASILAA